LKKPIAQAAFLLVTAAVLAASVPRQKTELPERYKTWLDEEVVYIITRTERSVFLELQTDRERDLFIEAFWKHRDPTPNSPENEFRTEHYRRIAYANRYLGRETPRPGWRTDRGRIYIILGEPLEIQRFDGKPGVYNSEVWFYQGKVELGLPTGFHLVFFQGSGYGEYKLYSPASDGPMALMSNFMGDPVDYIAAYEELREIQPELAGVSLSLIPGEQTGASGRPSLASDLLIQRIESSPSRTVEEQYAQKFLQYKDLVEVEYSANYLGSDTLVKVFREPSGVYFVHYAIEPDRLSLGGYENKYYTTFRLNGRVTTRDGRLVFQYDKTINLDLPEDQMKAVSNVPFDIHDLFPLVPGEYELSVLLKNEVSKEFTSLERTIRVPEDGPTLQMTQPLLGYRATRLEPGQMRMKAFRVGPYQISCQPNRVFTTKDRLAVAFQLNEMSADLRSEGEVRFSFLKDDEPFRETVRKAAALSDLPDVVEEFPLGDFPPAHYRLEVAFWKGGAKVVAATEEFDVTFSESVARPWFSTRVLPDASDPAYAQIVGAQLYNLNRVAEARGFFERAFEKKPDSADAASALAQVYVALREYGRAIDTLAPFLAGEEVPSYEMSILAGRAHRMAGRYEDATEILDRAVSHYGVNSSILNELGECYLGRGRTDEALKVFERSLELSPEQPEIRKKVEALKKRKEGVG
jgi:GWxTD domain-containing protein